MQRNSTNTVFMVRPASFGFNPETAKSNFFQTDSEAISNQQAVAEFDGMVEGLRAAGVDVRVFEDTAEPPKPDAVFPNNWISAHPGGKLFVYPMWAKNRRIERRADIIEALSEDRTVHDLSGNEAQELFLEGTGSMVLDHIGRKVYACPSPRTSPELVRSFAEMVDYEPLVFKAVDENGGAIYHTNVLMALGSTFSLICLDAVIEDRERIASALTSHERELIDISFDQMNAFAGNMLEVEGNDGRLVVMSSAAWNSLHQDQISRLSRHAKPLHFPIPTIEHNGGSVRCMIAEIYP